MTTNAGLMKPGVFFKSNSVIVPYGSCKAPSERTMIQVYYGNTAFEGKVILSREFFNAETKDYIHIEAHETATEGQFEVVFWVPDGNDGGHGFDGSLRHVVQQMSEYQSPEGFVEMKITNEHYC
jgi:hypothetical protein